MKDDSPDTISLPAHVPVPSFEYPKESIISYSQTNEDVLLWRALHTVKSGFYIDVGAHDPTELSVTRAFYDRGWHGINVEPNPTYAQKLREARPRDLTLEVALGHIPSIGTLHEFGNTGLSTLVKDIADEHSAKGIESTELRVPITTLAAILSSLSNHEVHFLKIDVEGYEHQVLLGGNFNNVRPWVVLIEAVRPMTTVSSYQTWEPLLLEAGYDYVYFDGLNRFYLAREHSELRRYFLVPVNICDPHQSYENRRLSDAIAELERDKIQQANLLARLSGTVADLEEERAALSREVTRVSKKLGEQERVIIDLEQNQAAPARWKNLNSDFQRSEIQHETPRLDYGRQIPIAADLTDAAGLLRVVEAQASDLVRLRRSLSLAETVARQRFQLIGDAGDGTVFGWLRAALLEDINRTRDAITDLVQGSRWRKLGQRLGVAKELHWEPTWQTRPVGPHKPEVSIKELQRELASLQGLLGPLRLSRWRKLGQWLGVAKRLDWEAGKLTDPLLLKPFPEVMELQSTINSQTRPSPSNYVGFIEYTTDRFLEECRGTAIDVILDVGANTGQFAEGVRERGYRGQIISFEPLSIAHATLAAVASEDSLWDVAPRCAVGAAEGWAEINISRNSYSSSLLPMLDRHREAAPQSAYQGTESCPVITLDAYIDSVFSDKTLQFGLKIDTQGYEVQVIEGLKRNRHRVKVIVCEMSVAPLYESAPSLSELCHTLAEVGYRCVALGPEFEDPRNGELLQINGVFVARA